METKEIICFSITNTVTYNPDSCWHFYPRNNEWFFGRYAHYSNKGAGFVFNGYAYILMFDRLFDCATICRLPIDEKHIFGEHYIYSSHDLSHDISLDHMKKYIISFLKKIGNISERIEITFASHE